MVGSHPDEPGDSMTAKSKAEVLPPRNAIALDTPGALSAPRPGTCRQRDCKAQKRTKLANDRQKNFSTWRLKMRDCGSKRYVEILQLKQASVKS